MHFDPNAGCTLQVVLFHGAEVALYYTAHEDGIGLIPDRKVKRIKAGGADLATVALWSTGKDLWDAVSAYLTAKHPAATPALTMCSVEAATIPLAMSCHYELSGHPLQVSLSGAIDAPANAALPDDLKTMATILYDGARQHLIDTTAQG